ncbi:MAG: hypothetical protein ACE5HN_03625 [Nitrospiria bacterium]
MIYKIKAGYIEEKMPEFYRRLTDGTILNQKPDGKEIVHAMQRARITAPGIIEWSETCYCPTPLLHERQTVYNYFLTDIQTVPTDEVVEFEGEPFMDFLEKQTGGPA